MKFYGLVVIFLYISYNNIHSSEDEHQSPIILIPGDGGSRLIAYNVKKSCSHPIRVWVNYLFLIFPRFLTYITKLSYNPLSHTTYSSNGYSIEIPGWGDTKTIEELDEISHSRSTYFKPLVKHLLRNSFYKRNITLRGAPYDFRKAPNEMDLYFKNLKELVEETYNFSNHRKVVLLGHSLGCMYSVYFLKIMPYYWKKKYIKALVTVSGPFAGSVGALLIETTGQSFSRSVKSYKYREMERSFPSSSFLLPNKNVFGNQTLIYTPKQNYSAHDYYSLFHELDFQDGYLMYNDVKNLIDPSESPSGPDEIHCLHGSGIKTISSYYMDSFNDGNPTKFIGPGDGKVNLNSLEMCKNWKNVQYKIIEGANHSNILQNTEFLNILDRILS